VGFLPFLDINHKLLFMDLLWLKGVFNKNYSFCFSIFVWVNEVI